MNLQWADASQRGYMSVAFAPDAVRGEWHFVQSIRDRGMQLAGTHAMTARHGVPRFDRG
ncbi:hypothetical protein [Croceibacterium mercuriale]|uniref:hypothetical protein n=1 Tax=Croceibacterium mercuriale TaxID=1572751 RepID=UPI000AEF3EE7|nr:hypothetical protein [Croceibacterium mercuriale]